MHLITPKFIEANSKISWEAKEQVWFNEQNIAGMTAVKSQDVGDYHGLLVNTKARMAYD